VDGIHAEAVQALRKAGIAVKSLASLGDGMPDLLCALRRYTCLVELKVPGGHLEAAQREFIESWPGDVWVAFSAEEAVLRVVEGARPMFAAAERRA